MRLILGALVLTAAVGCWGGERDKSETGENVPIDQVPAAVMKKAKEQLPDVVRFTQSWKTANGNYEVRGKEKNGKIRDVQVTPDGQKVVEID